MGSGVKTWPEQVNAQIESILEMLRGTTPGASDGADKGVGKKVFLTVTVLCALEAASLVYDMRIQKLKAAYAIPGQTALQVVFGTFYTLVAALLLIYLWAGLVATRIAFWCLTGAFAFAGLPMLIGNINATTRRNQPS